VNGLTPLLQVIAGLGAAFLGGGVVSGIAQIITAQSNAKTGEVESLRNTVMLMYTKVEKLCTEVDTLRAQNREMESEIRRLRDVMRAYNIDPDSGTPIPQADPLHNNINL
jgi:outer membrane murein-binding lipoprotein Lpp